MRASSSGSVPVVNSPSSSSWLGGKSRTAATATQMSGATSAEASAAVRAPPADPAPSALPTRVEAAMPKAEKPMKLMPGGRGGEATD